MEKLNKHDKKTLERRLIKLINEDKYSSVETIEIFPLFLIEKYKNQLDWVKISRFYCLSEEFIYKFVNLLDWYQLSRNENQTIPEDIFEEYIEEIDVCVLFDLNRIPINILKSFLPYINHKLEMRKKYGGIVYTPYIPIEETYVIEEGTFAPRQLISSRYSEVNINPTYYNKITIS